MDVYDILSGKVAPRRALALLRGLPDSSTTQQILRAHTETLAVRPEPDSETKRLSKYIGWGRTDVVLTAILNQMIALRYEMRGDRKAKKPVMIEIPQMSEAPKQSGITSLRRLAQLHAGDH